MSRNPVMSGAKVFISKHSKEFSVLVKHFHKKGQFCEKEPMADGLKNVPDADFTGLKIHSSVIRDVAEAKAFIDAVAIDNKKTLLCAFLFGGIVRHPEISHDDSDIDILLIKRSGSKLEFGFPGKRFSVKIYPYNYIKHIIVRDGHGYPEASFQRCVLLQPKHVLYDAGVVAELERYAEEYFDITDVLPLIHHRIRKNASALNLSVSQYLSDDKAYSRRVVAGILSYLCINKVYHEDLLNLFMLDSTGTDISVGAQEDWALLRK